MVAADTGDPPRPYYFLGVAVGLSVVCSVFTSLAVVTAVISARRLTEMREGMQRLRSRRSRLVLQKIPGGRGSEVLVRWLL